MRVCRRKRTVCQRLAGCSDVVEVNRTKLAGSGRFVGSTGVQIAPVTACFHVQKEATGGVTRLDQTVVRFPIH